MFDGCLINGVINLYSGHSFVDAIDLALILEVWNLA